MWKLSIGEAAPVVRQGKKTHSCRHVAMSFGIEDLNKGENTKPSKETWEISS
jgi:hypothetical protein